MVGTTVRDSVLIGMAWDVCGWLIVGTAVGGFRVDDGG